MNPKTMKTITKVLASNPYIATTAAIVTTIVAIRGIAFAGHMACSVIDKVEEAFDRAARIRR